MNRERWDSTGTPLLVVFCSLLLYLGPANLASQNLRTISSQTDPLSMTSVIKAAPPDWAFSEAVFDGSVGDSQDTSASGKADKDAWGKSPNSWRTIIYPVYAWAPFLGTDVKLPSIPSGPGGGGGGGGGGGSIIPEGTTSGSFNGAAFAGAEVSKNKWYLIGGGLYAGLSGQRTTPHTTIDLNMVFGQFTVGREVYKGLSAEAGFRRIAMKITADVLDYPSVSRKPGVWDPLIGATYRKDLTKKWRVSGNVDGGGFGVGCDYDISETGRADWRFAKHFGMTMGVAAWQFKISDTKSVTAGDTTLSKTLTMSQTTWGPVFGFGIYF
jgi:hypothetical protein